MNEGIEGPLVGRGHRPLRAGGGGEARGERVRGLTAGLRREIPRLRFAPLLSSSLRAAPLLGGDAISDAGQGGGCAAVLTARKRRSLATTTVTSFLHSEWCTCTMDFLGMTGERGGAGVGWASGRGGSGMHSRP
jgi:hypothetical protein